MRNNDRKPEKKHQREAAAAAAAQRRRQHEGEGDEGGRAERHVGVGEIYVMTVAGAASA